MIAFFRIGWVMALILVLMIPVPAYQAQSSIQFEPTQFENHFPRELIFNARVSSRAPIVKATLYYQLRGEPSFTQVTPAFEPAATTVLSYTWKTDKLSIPPSAPIVYYWEATDANGQTARTDEQMMRYDDLNYDWQKLDNDNLSVWWHDRPAAFGQQVFDIASRAFEDSKQLFQAKLDFPIRIIIHNTFAEFKDWSPYFSEVYAGQAFPELGLTVQIVEGIQSPDQWLNSVIPHEITHLYFYQATDHPLSNPPAWLNEGLAQYFEFSDNAAQRRGAERIIRGGGLIPLRALTGGFGNVDQYKVALSYAESLSAVTYMVDTYGKEGVAKLLAAFKAGKSTEKALQAAFNRTPEEFQQDWLDSLGVPADLYPTPTPWPTRAPIPTAVLQAGPPPAHTPQPSVTPAATATAISVAIAQINPVEASPVPENTPTTAPITLVGAMGIGAIVVIAIIVAVAAKRRSTQARDR
jgi:hypothetical protein